MTLLDGFVCRDEKQRRQEWWRLWEKQQDAVSLMIADEGRDGSLETGFPRIEHAGKEPCVFAGGSGPNQRRESRTRDLN